MTTPPSSQPAPPDRETSGLAVGAAPLLEEGAWHPFNSVVAAVVLAVVAAYSYEVFTPRDAERREVFATSIVLGFLAAVALAWIVQSFLAGSLDPSILPNDAPEIDRATWVSLGIGATLAGTLARLGLHRKKPDRTVEATTAGSETAAERDPEQPTASPPKVD